MLLLCNISLDCFALLESVPIISTYINKYMHAFFSREDLVNKFQQDLPNLSSTELQTEVDKFLMDGEMLDMYIKYNQRKAEDPDWEPMYAPENNSPLRKAVDFVSQYGFYVVLGVLAKDIIDGYVKKGDAGAAAAAAGGDAVDTLVSSVPTDVMHHMTNTLSA